MFHGSARCHSLSEINSNYLQVNGNKTSIAGDAEKIVAKWINKDIRNHKKLQQDCERLRRRRSYSQTNGNIPMKQ